MERPAEPPLIGGDVGRHGNHLLVTGMQKGTRLRASEALFAVNQANTIYGLIFIVLTEFPGFESEKWFFKLAAQIQFSAFVDSNEAPDVMIGAAFREVADHRLPRLLSISLVSIVEACLEDIAAIELAAGRGLTPEQAASEARRLMRGGPADYLSRLEELGLTFVTSRTGRSYERLLPQGTSSFTGVSSLPMKGT